MSVDLAGGERGAPTQLFAIAIASVLAQPSRIGWMMPTPWSTGLRLRHLCLVTFGFTSKSVGFLMPSIARPPLGLPLLVCLFAWLGVLSASVWMVPVSCLAPVSLADCSTWERSPCAWQCTYQRVIGFGIHLHDGRRVRRSCGTMPVAGLC